LVRPHLKYHSLANVYSANVRHTVNEDGYWFGGWFKYAGVHSRSKAQSTIESKYIAHYNPSKNLDPNLGLEIVPPAKIKGARGSSSESRRIQLTAKGIPADQGTVFWYVKQNNSFKKVGQGLSCNANFRIKKGMDKQMFYACVKLKNGIQGGKVPVAVEIEEQKV